MQDSEKRSVLETTNQWIFNCDTKTSIYLATLGVFLSIILTSDIGNAIVNIIKLTIAYKSICNVAYLIFLIVGVVFLIIGIYKLTRVLIPNIDLSHDSVMFFGKVASYSSFDEYRNTSNACNANEISDDLLHQIYTASKICAQKFKNHKQGIILSSLGVTIIIVWLLFGFITYYI